MPVYLRTGGYKIYFWSNENGEPIHFHVTKGNPGKDDTKIWALSNGSFKLAHNKGKIPEKDLSRIFSAMQNYYLDFISFWKTYHHDELKFYE
ncbi:MAG: DUF4160 domain-containing protein [Treponema sp.]|nr:DUF4160 domain-containing protein [Treponema sp.]